MCIHIQKAVAITLSLAASCQIQAQSAMQNKGHPHQRPSFNSLDSNADKNIDFNEFSSHKLPHSDHKTVFSIIDSNNNGLISNQEFITHKSLRPKK